MSDTIAPPSRHFRYYVIAPAGPGPWAWVRATTPPDVPPCDLFGPFCSRVMARAIAGELRRVDKFSVADAEVKMCRRRLELEGE